MIDREKVIKGLEICLEDEYCNGCPYEENCFDPDTDNPWGSYLKRDALALLKEQEAVKPYVTGRGESFETAETWWYACGNCHEALDPDDKYCRHCGRQVKWDD